MAGLTICVKCCSAHFSTEPCLGKESRDYFDPVNVMGLDIFPNTCYSKNRRNNMSSVFDEIEAVANEYLDEGHCDLCSAPVETCQCTPEQQIADIKQRLEKAFDCDVEINLYKEGALLASSETEDDITW